MNLKPQGSSCSKQGCMPDSRLADRLDIIYPFYGKKNFHLHKIDDQALEL